MFQLSWRHQLWRLLGFACPERWAMASRGVHIRPYEMRTVYNNSCWALISWGGRWPWPKYMGYQPPERGWPPDHRFLSKAVRQRWYQAKLKLDGNPYHATEVVYCELMSFYLLSTSLVAVPNSTTGSESEFPPKSKQDCKWWSCRKRHLDPWDTYQYDGLGIWSHICEWFHFLKDGVGSLILEWNRDIRYLGPLNGIFKVSARTACFLPSN